MQASEVIRSTYDIFSYYLVCLAQALDLRKRTLKGSVSRNVYKEVRQLVPFVDRDRSLGDQVAHLSARLKQMARESEGDLFKNPGA